MLCGLPLKEDPALLLGLEQPDDAGAYRLPNGSVLVQTVDFFTPVSDEPRMFGRIAAANSLSDIYAMNAKPLTALNILCWPQKIEEQTVREILEGGLEALDEAGCLLVGGHTVDDEELKFGFAVTGLADEARLWRSNAAKPGCVIILTKPIGTGVIATAVKGGLAEGEWIEAAQRSMATLNKAAQEAVSHIAVTATDITGFGLLGHLSVVAEASGVTVVVYAESVPLLPGAADAVNMGLVPEGLYRNRAFYAPKIERQDAVDDWLFDLLNDPQTSGGLALFVEEGRGEEALAALRNASVPAAVIGRTTTKGAKPIRLQSRP